MRAKRTDDKRMRELVRRGGDFAPIPKKTEAQVLSVIREKTAARPRPSLFTLVRYSPAFAAAAAAVVVLPLAAVLAGAFLFSGPRTPMLAVSEKGGTLVSRARPLKAGDAVNEKDVIRTGPGEQAALERSGIIALQLFSNSLLEITGFSDARRDLDLRLHEGALYADKRRLANDPSVVAVAVDAYRFTLRGTRVYFSVDGLRRIRVICYNGAVDVGSEALPAGELLFTVSAGEKADIRPDGTWSKSAAFSPEELELDRQLALGLPRLEFVKELPLAAADGPESAAGEHDPGGTIPPYAITQVGSIRGRAATDDGVNFYGALAAGGRMFLINEGSVFTLETSGPVERSGLIPKAAFMVKPFAAGRYAAFATPGAIDLVDPATLALAASVALPKEGSIDHNFLPAVQGGALYVAVQNHGYYRLDLDARPLELRLLAQEPFPLAPAAAAGTVYIGSYYNNYIGAVALSGETVWKTALKGASFADFVVEGKSLFHYQAEPGGFFMVRFDEAGKETGRWPIPGELKADFRVLGGGIIGVLADGRLFRLDTVSGKTALWDRIFNRRLSTRQWRNISLLFAGRLLYAPTDRGTILVMDLLRGQKDDEIDIDRREAFYTAPFLHERTLYAIGNSGRVYRVVKNAR